ncbi:MAG: SemiSWEET family sugar transporter [Terriglobales bacterium]
MSTAIPNFTTTVGLAAGAFTTLSFVPQLLRTVRTRSANDMSGWWLAGFIGGLTLWLIYGLLLPSMPIILANIATLLLTLPILVIKIYFHQRE